MFVKVSGGHRPHRHGATTSEATLYISTDWIEEIAAGPPVYKLDDQNQPVKDDEGQPVVDHETVELWVAGSDNLQHQEPRFTVRGSLDDVMARITAAIEAGKACCDPEAKDEKTG